MKLILVGCEYSGKTTLQLLISAWLQRITGSHRPVFPRSLRSAFGRTTAD